MAPRVGIAGYGLAGRYFHAPLLVGAGFEIASITTLFAVWKARKDLRLLALFQVLGIFGQGVLGGITVLTQLNPIPVAGHFILSIFLIAGATSLFLKRDRPLTKVSDSWLSKAHIICAFLADLS